MGELALFLSPYSRVMLVTSRLHSQQEVGMLFFLQSVVPIIKITGFRLPLFDWPVFYGVYGSGFYIWSKAVVGSTSIV